MLSFTDALRERQKRARLSGRPMAQSEARGIAEGYSDSASARLARAKQLQLQEDQIANQDAQFARRMSLMEDQDAYQRKIAEDAIDAQKSSDRQALALGVVGTLLQPALQKAGEGLSSFIFSAFDGFSF